MNYVRTTKNIVKYNCLLHKYKVYRDNEKREREPLCVERIEIPHILCLENLYDAKSIDKCLIDKIH